jgi:hypothetical protein
MALRPPADLKRVAVFCTYAHYTSHGNPFYIGKGSGDRRPYYFKGRNDYWNKVVAKHGTPKVEILAQWPTEAEAFEHERFLISCFKELGYKLCNLTDGGDGTSGYKQTEEHRQKNRENRLGKSASWNVGRKHSEETKRKCGAANVGKPASEKQKQIASQLSKGNKHAAGNTNNRRWKWVGTNIEDGSVVLFIGSIALNAAGFQHANVIKCLNGTRKSHKGYTWHKELLEIK